MICRKQNIKCYLCKVFCFWILINRNSFNSLSKRYADKLKQNNWLGSHSITLAIFNYDYDHFKSYIRFFYYIRMLNQRVRESWNVNSHIKINVVCVCAESVITIIYQSFVTITYFLELIR